MNRQTLLKRLPSLAVGKYYKNYRNLWEFIEWKYFPSCDGTDLSAGLELDGAARLFASGRSWSVERRRTVRRWSEAPGTSFHTLVTLSESECQKELSSPIPMALGRICKIRWLKFYLNRPIESLVLHLCRVEAWQDTDSCLIPSFPLPDPSYPMSECNSSNKGGIIVYKDNVRMTSSVDIPWSVKQVSSKAIGTVLTSQYIIYSRFIPILHPNLYTQKYFNISITKLHGPLNSVMHRNAQKIISRHNNFKTQFMSTIMARE